MEHVKNYVIVVTFDNKQEYNFRLQMPQLSATQINDILTTIIQGNSMQGIIVNPQRVLFARIIELPDIVEVNTEAVDAESERG